MVKHYHVLILIITSVTTGLSAANNEKIKMNREQIEVIESVETMTSAFHKKDIEGVINSYEQAAAVMFEPGSKVTNLAMIAEMFKGVFQTNPKFDYPDGHEVYIADNIALHIAPWLMKAQTPDGSRVEQRGLSVAVLRKQKDGKWLLLLDNPHGQRLLEK